MPLKRIRIVVFRGILVASLGIVTYLALMPGTYPGIQEVSDKFLHAAAFYSLALMVDFSFPVTGYSAKKILPLLVYGILIEIVQCYLPYRFFSLMDIGADAFGLIAYGLSLPLLKILPVFGMRWRKINQRHTGSHNDSA